MKEKLTLERLQKEQECWQLKNFSREPHGFSWVQSLMGISEEVGELNHALLKQWQNIRGTRDELEELAKDAVGDIIVFLAGLCNNRRWDMQEIVEKTWSEVKNREWNQT